MARIGKHHSDIIMDLVPLIIPIAYKQLHSTVYIYTGV